MPATVVKIEVADFILWQESVNAQNELVTSFTPIGQAPQSQVLAIGPPCLVVYDPVTLNLSQIPITLQPGQKVVEFIRSVEP